ncbi:MAG: helix-turn-helix transcriptional regulator [Patescibacteria group bacterium]|nr:helix-turn-helix transcriptional regulator [Patescibacteria group bacterium]MDE1945685.1 helix-turn-helix transcriptional regulator [Patescibacteria group bacterium]
MTPRGKKLPSGACPIKKTAELLSDTWTILIVRDLLSGGKRFSELERHLETISTRTLAVKLERLIREKLAKKSGVAYALTAKGRHLGAIFDAMSKYGKKYL